MACASSSLLFGPSASRLGIAMLAATYRARETQNCGIIWSMAMDGGYCTTWVVQTFASPP